MRSMLAPGAMACAHSTSRASSTSRLFVPGPFGSVPGRFVVWPFWLYLVKLGGSGRPNALSNWARSLELKFGAVLSTKLGSS